MSNPGYIHVITDDESEGVYLYTHDGKDDLKSILKAALLRGEDRWDDTQYLTRIIFCEMIQNDVLGSTGYGISSVKWDETSPVIHVHSDKQIILIENEMHTFEKYVQ